MTGDDETVMACPGCDSPSIIRRTNNPGTRGDNEGRWHCEGCGEYFDEPVEREPIYDADYGPTRGAAAELAKMGEANDDGDGDPP